MRIYTYKNSLREGALIETEMGWGEVAPLPGLSRETLPQAIEQLIQVSQGWKGPLYPSVEFGLESAMHQIQTPLRVPAALLFMGSKEKILSQAEQGRDFRHAKVKLKTLTVQEAVEVVRELKDHFRLRLDFNSAWTKEQLLKFCQHFDPSDIAFLEDPPGHPEGFAIASDQVERSKAIQVWKPTIKGIPKRNDIVLSSAFETGIGIAHIARLAQQLDVAYPIGVGTYKFLERDVLQEPLELKDGFLTVFRLEPNLELVLAHTHIDKEICLPPQQRSTQ